MRKENTQQLGALLAVRALETRLPRVRARAAAWVGHRALEVRAVVEQGVVPGARVVSGVARVCGAGRAHKGNERPVRDSLLAREELVEKDGAHVGLQINGVQVKGKGAYARSGCRTYSGKRLELLCVLWQLPAQLHDRSGRPVKGERPAVVSQPLPLVEHVRGVRLRERPHGREAGEPALPAAVHARGLGLLEHDLGDPDGIGIPRAAPGKVAVELPPALEHERAELRERKRGLEAGAAGDRHG